MSYEFGLSNRIYGVVYGVVIDNKHPEGAYQVKVSFPWIRSTEAGDDADYESNWARIVSPMAGKGRGFYTLPEIGDEVCVSFLHGDIRFPVVVGALWNDEDVAPVSDAAPADSEDPMGNDLGIGTAAQDNQAAGGDNNARFFISRSGSTLFFDDTEGKEKVNLFSAKGSMLTINDEKDVIAIYDHSKEVYLVLDAANKKITMETKSGDIEILAKSGEFRVEAKDIVTQASNKQSHNADGQWEQKSGGTMDLESGGDMTLKGGPNINLN